MNIITYNIMLSKCPITLLKQSLERCTDYAQAASVTSFYGSYISAIAFFDGKKVTDKKLKQFYNR